MNIPQTATGIPEALRHVQDRIFEGLTPSEARDWPGDFVAAIRPGTDLSDVTQRFLAWVMRDVVAHVEGAHFMERVADLAADVENDPASAGEAVFKAARSVAGKASQIPDDDVTEWTAEALAARRAVIEAAERAAYTRMAAILLEELARAA